MLPLMLILLFTPYYTYNVVNVTSPIQMLSQINQNPAYNGQFGMGLNLAIFALFFFIFTFRIKVVDAALAASFIAMISGLLLDGMQVLPPNEYLVFIGIFLLTAMASLVTHIFHPFD